LGDQIEVVVAFMTVLMTLDMLNFGRIREKRQELHYGYKQIPLGVQVAGAQSQFERTVLGDLFNKSRVITIYLQGSMRNRLRTINRGVEDKKQSCSAPRDFRSVGHGVVTKDCTRALGKATA
jgi:hypothetical protein